MEAQVLTMSCLSEEERLENLLQTRLGSRIRDLLQLLGWA